MQHFGALRWAETDVGSKTDSSYTPAPVSHNFIRPMQPISDFILQQTGARQAQPIETVQSLWSGYGKILRYQLLGCERQTVIVKHIYPPGVKRHPRGWATDQGHQRKLKSYQVESNWYEHWAQRCIEHCYVPHCLGIQKTEDHSAIILEDLNNSGFPRRASILSDAALRPCLSWLANFHACFLNEQPTGLWPVGTYWHLDTRPDELIAMADSPLKQAATKLDVLLSSARYKTIVHGDAKIANFCFSEDMTRVAAVDFQYVGGGCGMKDLAYFMGSCLSEHDCERLQNVCLDFYFNELKRSLHLQNKAVDFIELETEWRKLFPIAWADFYRFLQGWMPQHKKINNYSTRLTEQVLANL